MATKQKRATSKKGAAKKGRKSKSGSKRELIDTGTDKRFVRRSPGGQFSESDDVGRSLRQDVKRKSATRSKSGQGDKGDRRQKKG